MRADGALGQAQVLGELLDLVFPGAQVCQDHQARGVGQTVEQRRCGCVVLRGSGRVDGLPRTIIVILR